VREDADELSPPPAATQKVSERQDTEVKPPPGGRVVRTPLQPWAATVGSGTVVGVAEGGAVVVVDVVRGSETRVRR
jgi:hypothetical protein